MARQILLLILHDEFVIKKNNDEEHLYNMYAVHKFLFLWIDDKFLTLH